MGMILIAIVDYPVRQEERRRAQDRAYQESEESQDPFRFMTNVPSARSGSPRSLGGFRLRYS